jgi:cytochrome c oxidase cbb3-type subunit 3
MTRALWLAAVAVLACGGPPRDVTTGTEGRVPASVRHDQHVSAGGAIPPAAALTNPLRTDSAVVRQGERLFSAMNCDGCHGAGATGVVGPSLVDGRWRYGGDDGTVYRSIFYGRPRGMPAYGGLMAGGAIWQVVTYLRVQPVPKEVPTTSWQ